jgi:hypothetical protein
LAISAQAFGADDYAAALAGDSVANASAEAPSASSSPTAAEDISFETDCRARWTATADALIMSRTATAGAPLLLSPLGANLLNSAGLAFSPTVGPRLDLMRHAGNGWDLELNYFGLDSWNATADFPPAAIPATIGGLILDRSLKLPVTEAQFTYRSQIDSGEINLRHSCGGWLTALAGFRCVELEEQYAVTGTESVYGKPFQHAVDAHNHLFGFQLGADGRLLDRGGLSIDGIVKAGVLYDAASQDSQFADPTGVGNFAAAASAGQASFLGEIGLLASYHITPHMALRGGYQVLWLEGVALAPRQIPVTSLGAGTAAVDTSGGIFFQGANAGFEISW